MAKKKITYHDFIKAIERETGRIIESGSPEYYSYLPGFRMCSYEELDEFVNEGSK